MNPRFDEHSQAFRIVGAACSSQQVMDRLTVTRRAGARPVTASFPRSARYAAAQTGTRELDVTWLKAASASYNVSDDPRDYIFPDVPIVEADVPNRNFDCFTFDELLKWKPLMGMMTFQTFRHKPTHCSHDNKDPLKAKGAIFDVTMQKIGRVYYARVLLGFDRTKDPELTRDIASGKRNGYSMGALAKYLRCSYCGALTDTKLGCAHIIPKKSLGTDFQGRLAYNLCEDVNFIETSEVGDPAVFNAEQFWAL